MSELDVELGDKNVIGRCPDCGGTTVMVRGFVNRGGNAYAVYLFRWTEGRPDHGAEVIVSVGGWGGGSVDDRVFVALAYKLYEGRPSYMVVDAAELSWAMRACSARALLETPSSVTS